MLFTQEEIKTNVADKGYICPCCKSFVKRYTRSFNSNMALCLILLYRENKNEFVKVEDFLIKKGHKRCGDFSYLTHYKFLEKKKGDRKDGSNRNGFYRLTSWGVLFCEQKIKAKKKFMILNNRFEGFVGEEIDILQALGTKFNYQELMTNNG